MMKELKTEYQYTLPPWSWREKVLDFLKPEDRLLVLFPADGKLLFSLGHNPARCTVLVRRGQTLAFAPGGICVSEEEPEEPLPFPNGSFDVILADSVSYALPEIHRVLSLGGYFLTRQTGGEDSFTLRCLLGLKPAVERTSFNLENELPRFLQAGFRVMYRNQAYPVTRFFSPEAVCAFLSDRPLQFPDFSREKLPPLQAELKEQGFLENEEHVFILIGKKK